MLAIISAQLVNNKIHVVALLFLLLYVHGKQLRSCLGVELVIYRTAIGLFHGATHRSLNLLRSVFNFRLQFQSASAAFVLYFPALFLRKTKDEFTFYRIVLLLMCMDVHSNPGPSTSVTHT